MVAQGTRGLAAMRAVLNWTPVQAHATRHVVACFYICPAAAQAACVPAWDAWREVSVRFTPIYTGEAQAGSAGSSNGAAGGGSADPDRPLVLPGDAGSSASSGGGSAAMPAQQVLRLLDQALFLRPGGLGGAAGGPPGQATVLMAGLPGETASSLAKMLAQAGVQNERMLFCDYF